MKELKYSKIHNIPEQIKKKKKIKIQNHKNPTHFIIYEMYDVWIWNKFYFSWYRISITQSPTTFLSMQTEGTITQSSAPYKIECKQYLIKMHWWSLRQSFRNNVCSDIKIKEQATFCTDFKTMSDFLCWSTFFNQIINGLNFHVKQHS